MMELEQAPLKKEAGLGGVILVGGDSLRMGQDKAQLRFETKTFLERIAMEVAKVCDPVAVVSRPGKLCPALPGTLALIDQRVDHGPLEGIRVGLEALAKEGCRHAFVCGCDAPLVRAGFIQGLFSLIGSFEAIMPTHRNRRYGLTAIYQTNLHRRLDELLNSGERRVQSLASHFETRLVPTDQLREIDPELRSLINVNTPEQYRRLLAWQNDGDD